MLLTTFFVFINCKSQVADKASVKGIAKGIKEIVEAAGGSEKLKAVAATGENNKKAGKLFGKAGADAGDSEAASKAAGAVSAVSGEQILSAIVTAAGAAEQDGEKPGDATNPIAAAIGKGNADAGAEFGKEGMKKDDQIAAAIALRGMAKDGKFAVKSGGDEKEKAEGAIKGAAESLDKLVKAVKTAEGASSGTDAIGEVVDNAAKAADKDSVTGIAKGIKEIVEAAGGSEKLKVAAAKEGNEKAGKLFGKAGDNANNAGDSEAASKAAGAVSAVSGEQILSAIVTAAGAAEQEGEKPADATNPIAAAIGNKDADDGAEFDKEGMKKDDQIAAAIALRGMAKDGKFAVKSDGDEKGKAEGAIKGAGELLDKLVKAVKTAEGASSGTAAIGEVVANAGAAKVADKASVTGIAKGIKEIVEAAGGSEKLKAVAAAKGESNKEAGKLFGKAGANAHGDSEAASKAAGAVSAVSGEQILSAIVTAAGAADQDGEKPGDAKNPIAAAIGKGDADAGAEFGKEGMKKDDQIAAAIALRGMAKDGKFAVKSNGGEKGKAEGAIKEVSELLDKLVKAVKTAEGASSGTAAIGEVVDNDAEAADKDSVTGIAKGIKEIVEAAGGSEKLKAVAAAKGESNKEAGKLFGKAGADAGANGDSEAASKAAGAVSAVSGEQILSAIVTAAGAADQDGKKPGDAKNPIAAAIGKGDADAGADFNKDGMKKDDQIAAAIALRGMAKDGKFAVKNDEKGKAEGASSGTAAIGEVVDNDGDAEAADKDSVKGIAKGIKEIVEAAGGSEKLKAAAAEGENNKKAGKLFGKAGAGANGDSEAASKAAGAVSAVSGEQILSAIVTAAGAAEQDGKKPADATNPIAAAIALRGMAKDGKFAVKSNNNEKGKAEGAIKGAGELLDKLVKAVKTAEGASSGTDAIGEVVDNDAKVADKDSVTGIAKGIKEIVEAAGGSEKLKVAATTGESNKEAGKLFGKAGAHADGDSEAASKAAGAVSAVSGEQILSAIVKAAAAGAADQDGEKPEDAKNPIAAAIGKGDEEDGADFDNEMKKDDQIAAAIALRGMAKDGKFAVKNGGGEKEKAEGAIKGAGELLDKLVKAVKTAEGASSGTDAIGEVVADDADAKAADKASVTGIAKGIKEIVEAAGGSEKLKVAAATGENNKEAGKLFGKAGAHADGDSEAASKAAGAVSAVSGEQILSAIVKAAAADAADQEGKKPGDATNPIAAAIGNKDEDGAEFGDGMKKDDQIAAAIALRGMAKDGKFAVKNDEKEKAEGAIKEVSELLDKLVKAVKTAEGASSGTAAIGEVVDNDAKAADKASVTGIAKGIKEIVEAARGSEKLKAVAAEGENNKGAGKLFGKAGDDANGDSEAASKAAGAVSAVSGEQILSAIVTAAGAAEQDGEKPADATNPIAAAIGDKDGDADFGEGMKKDDQIAAAIALRGMAKDGKFAVKDGGEKEKAEGASSGTAAIGEVVDNDAKAADKDSVKGIAKGIKEIVEAAGGSEKLKAVAAAKGGNEKAGKLFGKAGADAGANGDSEAASKAAGAVSAVSGEQILSAIVTAAGEAEQDGEKPGDATNPIAAAIGKGNADAGADFDKEGMKKDDQIAAAIALRGMAKDGKFAVKSGGEKGKAEGAIKGVSELLDKLVKAVKTAEGASSGTAAIGEVVDNDGDAEAADKDSVKGIAKGIKEIVEAAGGSEKLKAAAAEGENNKKAGKLFGKAGAC
ncbi:variable large family protein [Borreliella burgdorferi]|uniref:variable large family protein n=1 Tax=Borreliella burgdorferi TaxID=139 RepID=UPI003B5029ED